MPEAVNDHGCGYPYQCGTDKCVSVAMERIAQSHVVGSSLRFSPESYITVRGREDGP